MALSDKNKRDYSAVEIAILEGVIDYADRMIYEDQKLDALGGFADTRGYVSHSRSLSDLSPSEPTKSVWRVF